jgi:hypothetical protein
MLLFAAPSSPVHNRRLLSARNMRMSSVELPDDNEKSLSSASTSPCPSPVIGHFCFRNLLILSAFSCLCKKLSHWKPIVSSNCKNYSLYKLLQRKICAKNFAEKTLSQHFGLKVAKSLLGLTFVNVLKKHPKFV